MAFILRNCHIWALIATAEPGNCPRKPFSLPLKGHSQGRWNQGAGGACTPKISNTPKVPFFLSEKCPFKVNHAPFLLRKRAFSSIFKSINANFCPWRACTVIIEKAQSGQRGTYALMGHLSGHIWALIATAEPGNCPREPFSLPLKGHSQGRWNQGAGGACTPKISTPKKCHF